jgi:hypothetical protein
MMDEELLLQARELQPVFVDGFGAFRKANGVFRCVGYFDNTAILSLVISLGGARVASIESLRTLRGCPPGKMSSGLASKATH